MEYESVNYDLVIVGAGPAGLSSAIKLKQLDKKNNTNHSVCIIEKGAEVGSHIISGAILDTLALSELFPNWKEMDAPIKTRVVEEEFSILLENSHINLPNFLHLFHLVDLGSLKVSSFCFLVLLAPENQNHHLTMAA